jgi:hypothetical protein
LPPASLLLRFDTPQGSKAIRENAESLLEVRYEKSFYTGQSLIFKRKQWDHRLAPVAITGSGLTLAIEKERQPPGERVLRLN